METEFKWFIGWAILVFVLAGAGIGFVVWVIIKLLAHFGVI